MDRIISLFKPIEIADSEEVVQAIHKHFRIPIEYNDLHKPVHENINADIELFEKENGGVYHVLTRADGTFDRCISERWSSYYTTDVAYLTETQRMFSDFVPECQNEDEELIKIWKDVRENEYFVDKYSFINLQALENLNKNPTFMSLNTVTNILSPFMFLLVPLIILIIPLIAIKLRGYPMTFGSYARIFMSISRTHVMGKMFSGNMDANGIIRCILYGGILLFQIYSNINNCRKYYENLKFVNSALCNLRTFIVRTRRNMSQLARIDGISTWSPFINAMQIHEKQLSHIYDRIGHVKPFAFSASAIWNFGDMLTTYYNISQTPHLHEALAYAFGFDGFCRNIDCIRQSIHEERINKTVFTTDADKIEFVNQEYPLLDNDSGVKNSCCLKQNMIISGANGSGKTTILKTTMLNVLLSQQIGYGFFESGTLVPYTHMHSYLNIPDTSSRDSLFQAESRRCKEIIDCIAENPSSSGYRHFCIFDELYSGTNPYEASRAGEAFLRHLNNHDGVSYMLTTHYLEMCNKLKKDRRVKNYRMETELDGDELIYTYRISKGISKQKGALHVLKSMQYPESIINDIVKSCT